MQWTCPEDVARVLFSPSGLLLATTRYSGDDSGKDVLRLWDSIGGQEVARLEDLNPTFSIAFASEREVVVVEEHRCLLWDSATGGVRELWKNTRDPAWLESRRFTGGTVTPDGKTLVVGLASAILIVDLPSGKLRHRLRTPPETEVWYDAFSATDGFLAAICTANRHVFASIALWDIRAGKRLRTYELSDGDSGPVAIHPDGRFVAVASGKSLCAFGMETEEELDGFRPRQLGVIGGLRYSADGRALEAVADGRLIRMDPATGRSLVNRRIPTHLNLGGYRAAIDPNGDKVALAAYREVEVLDLLA